MLTPRHHDHSESPELTGARPTRGLRHFGRALSVALLGGLLTLAACEEGAAEEAGEEIDQLMHEAEDAAEEAVDEVEKAVDDAHDGVNKNG